MYLVPLLFIFYIQGVLKLKKNNPSAKRFMHCIEEPHLYKRDLAPPPMHIV